MKQVGTGYAANELILPSQEDITTWTATDPFALLIAMEQRLANLETRLQQLEDLLRAYHDRLPYLPPPPKHRKGKD